MLSFEKCQIFRRLFELRGGVAHMPKLCRAEAVEAEHVPKRNSEAGSEESECKLLAQGSAIIAKDSEKA